MFKRKDPPTSAAGAAKKKSGAQSYLTSWVKPTVETSTDKPSVVTLDSLAAGLDDNTKKLLKLEVDTMDKEWLLALKAEFKKNYFLEVYMVNSGELYGICASCVRVSCDFNTPLSTFCYVVKEISCH